MYQTVTEPLISLNELDIDKKAHTLFRVEC